MVISTVNQVIYNGDGVTTAWPYTFRIIDATDIKLLLIDADGTETDITSDYYVDMVNNTVYYPGYAPGAEPPEENQPPKVQSGQKLVVYREIPITQETDLGEKWPFYVIELGLDKLTMILQQVHGWWNRSFKVPLSITAINPDFSTDVPVEKDKAIVGGDNGLVAKDVILQSSGNWDAKGLKIRNLADPSADGDAVNRLWARNCFLNVPLEIADNFSTLIRPEANRFLRVNNAGNGIAMTEAMMPSSTIPNAWQADAKRIINVAAPGNIYDATNKEYVDNAIAEKIEIRTSVKEFGAKGDGVTDDTAAIQAANNSGKSIFFPKGVYPASALTMSTSWDMADGAELLYTGEDGQVFIRCASDNIVHGDIVINGNGKQIDKGLYLSGNNNTFKRVKVYNVTSSTMLSRAIYITGNNNNFNMCEFDDLVMDGYSNDSSPQGLSITGTATGNVFDCVIGRNCRSVVVNNAGANTINNIGNIYAINCNDNGLYCVNAGTTICDAVFYDGTDNAVGFRHGCNASVGEIYVAKAGASSVFFGDCGDINIGSIYVVNSPNVILHTNQSDTGDIKIGAIKGSVSAMVFALFRNANNPNVVKSLSIDTIDLVANWDSTFTLATCMDFTAVDEIHINTLRLKAICDNTPFSRYNITFNDTLLRKSDMGYVDINFYQSDGVTVDTTKAHQYINGTQALLSYSYSLLPLSGGTLTGQVNVSDGKAIHFVDSSQVTGGYIGAVGTGLRLTAGGFGLSQPGGRIELRDRSYATDPGMFEFVAADANNSTSLIGKPSGVLRWGDNDILTSVGGTMTTADVLKRNGDTAYLRIMGGSGYTTGASITLMGQDRGSQPGEFVFRAKGTSSYKDLNGKPDGTLLWAGKNVERINASGDGYIRYESGLQICWSAVADVTTTDQTVTLPVAFKDGNYVITFGGSSGNTPMFRAITSTSFDLCMSSGTDNIRYVAIGYWK